MKSFGEFHDGFLDGLLIQDTTAHVFLSTDEKQASVLEVGEVLSLKLDGFRQGNIIFEVLVREGQEVTYQDIMDFFEFTDETKALKKLEEAHRENLLVVEINPSYGASCLILGRSVDLVSRQEGQIVSRSQLLDSLLKPSGRPSGAALLGVAGP